MIGYRVGNTLSESGAVSRGVCEVDENNFLRNVVERERRTPSVETDGVVYSISAWPFLFFVLLSAKYNQSFQSKHNTFKVRWGGTGLTFAAIGLQVWPVGAANVPYSKGMGVLACH